MTQPITRKRALELAQECIAMAMERPYKNLTTTTIVINSPEKFDEETVRISQENQPYYQAKYAELAAALAFIENMARQKELL